MINKILTGAGLIKNKTYRETRIITPPKDISYAVYSDAQEIRGADNLNLIKEHDVTIEVYEYAPDADIEKKIEDQFNLYGLSYVKQPRYYIQEEQLYQVIYEFTYIDKGGQNL